jgi:hypothetical protein
MLTSQELFQRLSEVLDEMPSVGNLDCIGRASADTICISREGRLLSLSARSGYGAEVYRH